MSLTDSQAIIASRESPEAFEVLFERHFEPIRSYLERRIGPAVGSDLRLGRDTRRRCALRV